MKTIPQIKQIEKEIRDYCVKLFLNTKIEDWNIEDYYYIKNNIKLDIYRYNDIFFSAFIFSDSTLTYCHEKIYFRIKYFRKIFFNKNQKKEYKLIKSKYNEILEYIDNKLYYEKTITTYNLLPIKEIRKNKLNNIIES